MAMRTSNNISELILLPSIRVGPMARSDSNCRNLSSSERLDTGVGDVVNAIILFGDGDNLLNPLNSNEASFDVDILGPKIGGEDTICGLEGDADDEFEDAKDGRKC